MNGDVHTALQEMTPIYSATCFRVRKQCAHACFLALSKCRIILLITHLEEGAMTLQTQHTANAPATLTDEQRRRVAEALEHAQSVNTRRSYAGQLRKFRDWCGHEGQSAFQASPVTRGRQLEAEKMSVTLPDEATGAAKIIGVDQRSR